MFQSAPWLEATENEHRLEVWDSLAEFQSAPWLEATENKFMDLLHEEVMVSIRSVA